MDDSDSSQAIVEKLTQIQGLIEKLAPLGIKAKDEPAKIVAAAELLLEGLYAHRKLNRSEERGFSAPDKASRREQRQSADNEEQQYEDWQQRKSGRRGSFN